MEDHAVAACRQLKTRNRNTTTIFYHDSANMWTNDQPAGFGRIGQQPRFWNPTVLRADEGGLHSRALSHPCVARRTRNVRRHHHAKPSLTARTKS